MVRDAQSAGVVCGTAGLASHCKTVLTAANYSSNALL